MIPILYASTAIATLIAGPKIPRLEQPRADRAVVTDHNGRARAALAAADDARNGR
jgi:hypothetical protein